MSASETKPGSPNCPDWLDKVLGCFSPPFSFRNGGSAITGASKPGQQSAAAPDAPAQPKRSQQR